MAAYKLLFKRSVAKDLRSIPRRDLEKILKRLEELADCPRRPGCEKLTGQERYRVRLGIYRIIYEIKQHRLTVVVIKVGHRRDVYRRN